MSYGMYRTLIASLGAVALVLAAGAAVADPGILHVGGIAHVGAVAPPPPASPSSAARPMHHPSIHHHHRGTGALFPTAGDYYYGPSYDEEAMMDARTPRAANEMRYTCTLDIPWDYVHRCPQPVVPRD